MATKCTATPNSVSTRLNAACTARLRTTTPIAPAITISVAAMKTSSCKSYSPLSSAAGAALAASSAGSGGRMPYPSSPLHPT